MSSLSMPIRKFALWEQVRYYHSTGGALKNKVHFLFKRYSIFCMCDLPNSDGFSYFKLYYQYIARFTRGFLFVLNIFLIILSDNSIITSPHNQFCDRII